MPISTSRIDHPSCRVRSDSTSNLKSEFPRSASRKPEMALLGVLSASEVPLPIPVHLTPISSSVMEDAAVYTLEMTLSVDQICFVNKAKCKDGGWTMLIKAFILNSDYTAESGKVQVNTLTHPVDQKLTISIKIHSVQELDEFLYYPLLLNFCEVLSVMKDKKKPPEERAELVGQSTIDMMPFIKGETEIHGKWTVHPATPPDQKVDPAAAQAVSNETPECSLSVKLSRPLVSPSFQRAMNIITFDLLGFFSMPDPWINLAGAKSNSVGFTCVTAIPKSKFQERFLVSSGRAILTKPNTQFQKRWPSHPLIVTDAIFRQETCSLPETKYIVETGNLTDPKDWPGRYSAEHNRPFLPICTEFRCVLSEEAAELFRSTTMKTQVLPVEVFELTHPEKHIGTKKKGVAEGITQSTDDLVISRHGIAYINMKPLFYPQKQNILGAFTVKKFDSQTLMEKVNRTSLGAEIIKTAAALSIKAPGDKDGRFSIASKKTNEADHHASGTKSAPVDPSVALSAEADVRLYEDTKSYLYAEISLQKPISDHSFQEDFVEKVKEIVRPASPPPLSSEESGRQAEVMLKKHMENIFIKLGEHFASQVENDGHLSIPAIVANIERDLTASGDFHPIKEQLKLRIIHLIRMKYGKCQPIADPAEFDNFLSTLYEDLVQQSHQALNAILSRCHELPVDVMQPQDLQSLRIVAVEAELDMDQEKAEKSFLQRTKISPDKGSVWRDVGNFYLRWKNYEKARSAFKEMLIDDIINFDGLLLMANCYLEEGNFSTAATFFECAVTIYPKSPLGWTALGLFYLLSPHNTDGRAEIVTEYAFHQANLAIGSEEARLSSFKEFMRILEEEKAAALAQIIPDPTKPPPAGPAASARIDTETKTVSKGGSKKDNSKGQAGNAALETDKMKENLKTEAVFGHLLAIKPAKQKHPIPIDNIFWCAIPQLASLGLHQLTLQCALLMKDVVILNDPVYWRSIVLSLIEYRNYDAAAEWLERVKTNDVETADIFALYGHVNFFRQEYKSAASNYRRALHLTTNVTDPFQLYFCYGRLSEKLGHHQKAAKMFFQAASLYPTCETWLGCGRAFYFLDDLENAECALQEANYIDNTHPAVWAFLSMIALRKGLPVTAERCRRCAMTFGVENTGDVFSMLEKAWQA